MWATLSAATEVTHGACENGFSDISAFVRPLLPAANITLTPRFRNGPGGDVDRGPSRVAVS